MDNTHLENQVNNNVENTSSNTDIKNENINVINISSIVNSTCEKIVTECESAENTESCCENTNSVDTCCKSTTETTYETCESGTVSSKIETCESETNSSEVETYENTTENSYQTVENTNATRSTEYSSTESTKYVASSYHNSTNTEKPGIGELPKIVQKLEKLEKMINPNSKKSLILWEEDNSFKNLISSIVTYSTTCDTTEFPIELLDRLKALAQDVDTQIAEGASKVEELTKQAKENTELSEVLSTVYIAAMAGTPVEEYEEKIQHPEIAPYKEHLSVISTAVPESEEYVKAEKAIKSKITNLENSVHITIDLERTTSKGGALQYIKVEVAPAVERLQAVYDEQYKVNEVTEINGEEAVMALAVRKTFSEKVYDTFVRPFANLFKRKSKVK